jgi:hypothetical protein
MESVGRTLERSNRARITSTDIGGPEALDEAVQQLIKLLEQRALALEAGVGGD